MGRSVAMYNYDSSENTTCGCFRRCSCCLWLISAIIGALLLATVGLILGAVFADAILGALSAIIVLAVILFVMLVLTIIYTICRCNR